MSLFGVFVISLLGLIFSMFILARVYSKDLIKLKVRDAITVVLGVYGVYITLPVLLGVVVKFLQSL